MLTLILNQLEEFYTKQKSLQEAERWITSLDQDDSKQQKLVVKLDKELHLLEEHKCFTCGQEIHDDKQQTIVESKISQKQDAEAHVVDNDTKRQEYISVIQEIGSIGSAPTVFYDTLQDAHNHRTSLAALKKELEQRENQEDPYDEQIQEMSDTGVEVVSWDTINDLTSMQDHQEFLLKLLTNKDSFIRKRIIDQNLAFLNTRLTYYLNKMGLPHSVKFMNDLTVEIQELLFIDEVVDSGMDASGVESALAVLKKMARDRNKSVWLVSHKDELAGRVNNLMKVIKENGFTSYDTDVEVV